MEAPDTGAEVEQPEASHPTEAHEEHMEEVRRWFDAHAGNWSDLYRKVRRVNDLVLIHRMEAAIGFIEEHVSPGSRILDAGCGAGWASVALARAGHFVNGVDLAPGMIERCEQNFAAAGIPTDRHRFTCGDLMKENLEEASFDGAVLLGVIQYQVDQESVLRRIHDLLRPGGVLVVSGPVERGIPNAFGIPADAGRALRALRILRSRQPRGRTRQRYSLPRFRRVLGRTGFAVIGHEGHGFGEWVLISRVLGHRGDLALHRVFSRLSSVTPIGRWGNDLVVVARKKG